MTIATFRFQTWRMVRASTAPCAVINQHSKYYSVPLHVELKQLRAFKIWALKKFHEIREKIDEKKENSKLSNRM